MLTIGICGASGCGKTTLAEELAKRIKGCAVLLNQDAYYRDHPHLTFAEREKLNYDEPGIFEHDLFYEDIRSLIAGQPIRRKAYDFANHRRADTDIMIEPADALIVEGIHVFYDSRVRDLLDFKIYIRVDPDICLLRRVQRDILERERSVEGVAAQYLNTVKPMFERWIRNYIDYADLIVAGGGKNQRIVDILAFYINHGMGNPPKEMPI
ncbi:MAG: uridine kinase [Christensenellales bacterium]|uniref:uridine/cytidine kinase n=1 Tax=Candidatus Avichristensenella intestinipullorum TaxID=2840693 RepID=A0A9D0YUU0_9FIRM|nr:uridine kinase [Christensenellales bacterium]HIQ62367.1 uridine kinase [Candidatus Avichristensenella intestinipullorum]